MFPNFTVEREALLLVSSVERSVYNLKTGSGYLNKHGTEKSTNPLTTKTIILLLAFFLGSVFKITLSKHS